MSVVSVVRLHVPDVLSPVKVLACVFSFSLLLAGANVGHGLESVVCEQVSYLGVVCKVQDSEKSIDFGYCIITVSNALKLI